MRCARRWDSGERSPCLDGVDRQTEFHDTGTSASQKVKLSVFCILRWESVGGSWAFFDPSVSRNSPLFRSGSTWDQDPHLSLLSRLSWQSYWPISRILWCKAPPSVSPHTGDKLPFLLSHPGQCLLRTKKCCHLQYALLSSKQEPLKVLMTQAV
jgi:hypothetical protein